MSATPLNITISPDLSVIRWFGRNQEPTTFTITNNDDRVIGTCELYCVRGDFLPKGAGRGEKAFLKKSIGEDLITQGWLEARLIDGAWQAMTAETPFMIGTINPAESIDFEIRLVIPDEVTNEGKTNFALMVSMKEELPPPEPEPVAGMLAWYDASSLENFSFIPSIRVDYYHCAWTQGCTPTYSSTLPEYIGTGTTQLHSYGGASWDTFRYVITGGVGLIRIRGLDASSVWTESAWGTDVTLEIYRGRQIWLDYQVSAESGGYVSTWYDLSGNDAHLSQTTQASKPRIDSDQQNELPAVTFDGSNDFLTAANTMLRGTSPYTVVAVWHPENTGSIPHLLYSGALATNSGLFFQELGGNWYHAWYGNDQTVPGAIAGLHLHTFGWDGSNRYVRTDGVQAQQAATGRNTATGNIRIGCSMANNGYLRGKVCELIIYDKWLSLQEIAETEEYLTLKWGL